ncbi:MAG: extracellular solute-binding protein [Firmicutes bacterium]|nr:extracellular solute-binding protein [Bacillota bacterium]
MSRKAVVLLFAVLFTGVSLLSVFTFAQPVTLTVMYQNSGQEDDLLRDWMNENVALFEKSHQNVKFNVISNATGDEYLTKITAMMAAGNTPDVFQGWTLGRMEPFAKAGRLYDLSKEFKKDPKFAAFLQKEPLQSTTFNGGVYGIPATLDGEFIFYNKKVFKKLGLSKPETYEDFLRIINVCKANGIIPIALGNKEIWIGTIPYMMLAERIGGLEAYRATVMEGTGKWTDTPFIEAGRKLQEWIKMGAFEPDVNGIPPEEARAKFINGKAAMYFMGTWEIAGLTSRMGVDGFGIFNLPDIKGGKGSSKHYLIIPNVAFSIGQNSQHKDVAVEFLKFIFSPERQRKFAKLGFIPTTKVSIDPAEANPIQVEALNAFASATGTMYPWDVPLGPALGKELNNTTQLLYAGVSPEKALAQLERIAQSMR